MFVLLIVIYIAFISLGLPDAVLGSMWPQVRLDLGAPLSYAGILSFIVSGGTILSSLFSTRIIRRFKTSGVTIISVVLTAVALLGYSQAQSFWWLCLMAIPLGLGAGSIDSALNNFVALHYNARQMSWLHCFWGVGATAGPIILSSVMRQEGGWKLGVGIISIIQFLLVILLLVSLPLWKKAEGPSLKNQETAFVSNREALAIKGVKTAVFSFFCYCAAELTAGLWAGTYLVEVKGLSNSVAAGFAALYYAGITIGRFFSGVLTEKFSSKTLIRFGSIVCVSGAVVMTLPLPTFFSVAGLMLIGIGCAPVFPSMLHETPARFGQVASQAIIGLQMACAYVGNMLMPPVFGWLAENTTVALYPFYLLVFFALMLYSCELTNRFLKGACHEK